MGARCAWTTSWLVCWPTEGVRCARAVARHALQACARAHGTRAARPLALVKHVAAANPIRRAAADPGRRVARAPPPPGGGGGGGAPRSTLQARGHVGRRPRVLEVGRAATGCPAHRGGTASPPTHVGTDRQYVSRGALQCPMVHIGGDGRGLRGVPLGLPGRTGVFPWMRARRRRLGGKGRIGWRAGGWASGGVTPRPRDGCVCRRGAVRGAGVSQRAALHRVRSA